MADSDSIKLCECGCGLPTKPSTRTRRGCRKGEPRRFVLGHNSVKSGGAPTNRRYRTPTYQAWRSMIDRCHNQRNQNYRLYGARGIKVCPEWRGSFKTFLTDMGERPEGRLSLDRINVNGNYEPGNCRWADNETQHNNKRTNRHITAFGRTQTITQWAREFGRCKVALRLRLNNGWPPEEAISTPPLSFSAAANRRWHP